MSRLLLHSPSAVVSESTVRRGMLVACALSLAGSLWALVVPDGCGSCQSASELMGGLNLAALGVLFYAHLMAALVFRGPSRYVFCWTMVVAAVHVALLGWLFTRRLICPPCLLTACGAFALTAISLVADRRNARVLAILVPMVLVLAAAAGPRLASIDRSALRQQRQVQIALRREAKEPPVPAGKVRVLIYGRPTCPHCQELDRKILPVVREEFGTSLEIQHRQAWKGLLSPTLVIRGQQRTAIRGLPTVQGLRQAIHFAQGRSREALAG